MISEVEVLPTDRATARRLGSRYYFTGVPCKHGHIIKRITVSGSCTTCVNQASINWAKKQPAQRLAKYTEIYRGKKKGTIEAVDGRKSIEIAEIIERINSVHANKLTLLSGYKNTGDTAQFSCNEHGEFTGWVGNVLRGQGCPKCSLALRTGNTEDFIRRATDLHRGAYDYSKVKYTTAIKKVSIICKKHGVFIQSPMKHLAGQSCPTCAGVNPKAEQDMVSFIESLGVKVQKQTRQVIPPYEIDIWLPEFNIGIEHHGLYWHTESRQKGKHKKKWEAAEAIGIRLIQVFEDEWANQKEIIKARFAALVGRDAKIMARKTTIKILTFPEARDFLNARHIQGIGPSCMSYGLMYRENLVAVATFGRARSGGMIINGGNNWEVYRYASEGTVVGGFGKLLSAFIKEHKPQKINSYCDLRYGNGRVYQATGFVLDSITIPDYWWVTPSGKERIPRYKVQKHKLEKHPILSKYYSPEKTENEICTEAGWLKIYGVGNQKWVWNSLDIPHPNMV